MNCRHAGFFYVLKLGRETTVRSLVSGRGAVLRVGSTVRSMNKKYDPVAAEQLTGQPTERPTVQFVAHHAEQPAVPSAPVVALTVADVEKLRWLCAQIHGPVILAEFREATLDAVADYRVDRGKRVGTAVIITVAALMLAVVAVLIGVSIMQGAVDWMHSMTEGS